MDLEQEEVRRIVQKILRIAGLTPSGLAVQAGLAASTLTRLLNNQEHKSAASFRTLMKLTVAAKLRLTVEDAEEASDPALAEHHEVLRALPEADRQSVFRFAEWRLKESATASVSPPPEAPPERERKGGR